MLKDIVEACPLAQHRLYLRFEDGVEGEIEIASMIHFTGILAPLANSSFFAQVTANPEFDIVIWPKGINFYPDVLHASITGIPIEQ